MANPLNRQPASYAATISLAEWCHDRNVSRLAERMSRWYFVNTNDGGEFVDCLEGDDGDNVRRLLDGKLDDFDGWPPKRMKGYRDWLRKCAMNGLRPNTLQNAA